MIILKHECRSSRSGLNGQKLLPLGVLEMTLHTQWGFPSSRDSKVVGLQLETGGLFDACIRITTKEGSMVAPSLCGLP